MHHRAHFTPVIRVGIKIDSAVFRFSLVDNKRAFLRHRCNARELFADCKVPEMLVGMIARHREVKFDLRGLHARRPQLVVCQLQRA
jgi:hypothetical protein